MKGSSCEVKDDGGSFMKRKYESGDGMEREALHGTAEEGPLWEKSWVYAVMGAQAKLMISPVENRPSETGLSLMDGAPGCAGGLGHL